MIQCRDQFHRLKKMKNLEKMLCKKYKEELSFNNMIQFKRVLLTEAVVSNMVEFLDN